MDHQEIINQARNYQSQVNFDLIDLDTDGDGISDARERALGTNPYDFDTDGDGVSDLKEERANTSPVEQKEKPPLKEQYYRHAAHLLGWTQHRELNWDILAQDVGSNRPLGEALDALVMEKALSEGQSLKESAMLLGQSPYLQNTKETMNAQQRQSYGLEVMSDAYLIVNHQQKTRQRENELSL